MTLKSDKFTKVIDAKDYNDRNLLPVLRKNCGRSTIYLECTLWENLYFDLYEDYLKLFPRVIKVRPGEEVLLPHQYFNVSTSDGSKVFLGEPTGVEAETDRFKKIKGHN